LRSSKIVIKFANLRHRKATRTATGNSVYSMVCAYCLRSAAISTRIRFATIFSIDSPPLDRISKSSSLLLFFEQTGSTRLHLEIARVRNHSLDHKCTDSIVRQLLLPLHVINVCVLNESAGEVCLLDRSGYIFIFLISALSSCKTTILIHLTLGPL